MAYLRRYFAICIIAFKIRALVGRLLHPPADVGAEPGKAVVYKRQNLEEHFMFPYTKHNTCAITK